MNILAICAHPDDVEILCAGTLIKYAKRGDKVSVLYSTDGSAGQKGTAPGNVTEIRKNEAKKACSLISAEMLWAGYKDEMLFDDEQTRLRFIELIRQANPDIIITHSPEDYHPDHVKTYEIVFGASFVSSIPKIKTETKVLPKVPRLLCMDTLAGIHFNPEFYVDITEVFEEKKDVLSCHESQIKWLKDHDNINILDFVEITNRFRGLQAGCKYAEGFREIRRWPRVSTENFLP